MRLVLAAALLCTGLAAASAETLTLAPAALTEWKAVHARIEARDTLLARARIGGSLIALDVTEGDTVTAGQRIATVTDDKLAFQVAAVDAQIAALAAQFENAGQELKRGRDLVKQGVSTNQRVAQLQTQVDVIAGQMDAARAQKQVLLQQAADGAVLAPADGRVIAVPAARGAVIMPGEPVATIASGGLFLRLAIPERHAALLKEGAELPVETATGTAHGKLAKLYPQIENGRVIADVDLGGLGDLGVAEDFVDARVLVRVPVGERAALLVPEAAIETRFGVDFVRVKAGEGEIERAVVPGMRDAGRVEILTGLSAGDIVILPDAGQ